MAAPATSTAAATVRTYFEAVAAHDLETMKACWAPDGIEAIHGVREGRGPDGVAEIFGEVFAALPDFEIEILDLIESGDKVAVHNRWTATFKGPGTLDGILPTGDRIEIGGCDVLTVREGKIVRNDAYLNRAEIMQQIGALPATGSRQERLMTGAMNLRTRLSRLLRR